MIKNLKLWSLASISVIFVALLLTVSIVRFGPIFEEIAEPVFTNVTAQFIKQTEDHVDILATGTKARSCLLYGGAVKVMVNGEWETGTISMFNQNGTPLLAEQQRIAKGDPFVRLVRVSPASTHVKIDIISVCHPLWKTRQTLFELDTSKTPAQVR